MQAGNNTSRSRSVTGLVLSYVVFYLRVPTAGLVSHTQVLLSTCIHAVCENEAYNIKGV